MTVLQSVTAGGAAGAPNELLDNNTKGVVGGVETQLLSVNLAQSRRIKLITVSGEVMAEAGLYINTVQVQRLYMGAEKTLRFWLDIQYPASTLIEVKVLHHRTDIAQAEFSGVVLGF